MSEQTFPLGDFNDLESSVKSITQQAEEAAAAQKAQEHHQTAEIPEAAGETSGAADAQGCRRQQAGLDAFHVYL